MEDGYPFTGTGNLFRFVQGLVGIGVHNNIVVVFDNDAEGVANLERVYQLSLPRNVRATCLPKRDEFMAFETIGPSGSAVVDIKALLTF